MSQSLLRRSLTAIIAVGAFALLGSLSADAQNGPVVVDAMGTYYDPTCNCNKNQDGATIVMMNATTMCVANCMTDAEWAACPTKSWWADSKDHRYRTQTFTQQYGMVCAPINAPRASYFTVSSTRRHIVFRFGPRS